MTHDLAAALLRDVPRFSLIDGPHHPFMGYATSGEYLHVSDVSSALTRALDPVLTERVVEEVESLRLWNRDDAADLITALLTANAALRAERETMIDAATVQKMLDDAQPIMAEACRGYEEANADLQARLTAAEAEVEKLRGERDALLNAGTSLVSALCDDHDVMSNVRIVDLINDMAAAIRAARAALTTEAGE